MHATRSAHKNIVQSTITTIGANTTYSRYLNFITQATTLLYTACMLHSSGSICLDLRLVTAVRVLTMERLGTELSLGRGTPGTAIDIYYVFLALNTTMGPDVYFTAA